MNDILHNIIQALEKLVMHGGATTNGIVPALISQAQDDLARAKAGLADAQGTPSTPVDDPPPVVEPAAPEPAAPPPPPADPAPEATAPDPADTAADALNAAEEQGLETAASPPPAEQPPAS